MLLLFLVLDFALPKGAQIRHIHGSTFFMFQ
jgi:hypothetical protein